MSNNSGMHSVLNMIGFGIVVLFSLIPIVCTVASVGGKDPLLTLQNRKKNWNSFVKPEWIHDYCISRGLNIIIDSALASGFDGYTCRLDTLAGVAAIMEKDKGIRMNMDMAYDRGIVFVFEDHLNELKYPWVVIVAPDEAELRRRYPRYPIYRDSFPEKDYGWICKYNNSRYICSPDFFLYKNSLYSDK